LTSVVFPGGKLFSVESRQDYYTESFNQWRLKRGEAEKDPYEWPLKKVIDLLAVSRNNGISETSKQVVEAQLAVDELRIDEWSQIVQRKLLKRFGNVPEPGPGRGEYFKKVSGSLTDHQMGKLAAKLAAGKIRGIEDFIPFVKKATLARLKHTMNELLTIVSNNSK